MMYITTDKGSTPYSRKVKTAPSTVPWLDKASATAIINTTYIQAIATTCMAYPPVRVPRDEESSVMTR